MMRALTSDAAYVISATIVAIFCMGTIASWISQ